jgi:hypothetical protein
MTAETLLSKLAKVKPTGKHRWQACCPAHDDKSPSMVVTEADDGRVLVHCFAGCGVDEIVGAVGLELSDLFPPRETHARPDRKPWRASDLIALAAHESLIVALAASWVAQGKALSDIDRSRLQSAAARLQGIHSAVNGR